MIINNLKSKYRKVFDDVKIENEKADNIYRNILIRGERKKKTRKVFCSLCLFLTIFTIAISITYAKEIKQIINNVTYKFLSKEDVGDMLDYGFSNDATGLHTISVNGYVRINEMPQKFNAKTLEELEAILNIRVLLPNVNFRYFDFYTYKPNLVYKIKGGIDNPVKVEIILSNFDPYFCISENYSQLSVEQCFDMMQELQPHNRLNMTVLFLTQYASEEQMKDFNIYLADFENHKIEIYESDVINSKIYISFNSYIVVRDNIVYILENRYNQFSKEEMIELIENMHY